MPSTYTTNLGIEKPATGEQSGTWGDTVNLNYDLFDQAINGVVSITLASAGTSGSPNTLAITDGTVSDGRNKFIEFVDGGDLGATAYVQLTPNDAEKIVHIRNSLSGGRSVIVFQGTYNASNDFEIPNGKDVVLKFDGAGTGAVVADVFVDLQVTGFTAGTADINGGTLDGVVIGGSSAAAATVTDFTASGTIDFSGATVSDGGTFTTIDIDGGTVDGVTIGGASAAAATVTDLTASGTVDFSGATVSDLGSVTTADINGGTADNVVIGGSTPAAATVTDLTASGTVDFSGATVSDLGTVTTVDINGGTVDGVVVGGATPAAGTFTALTASGDVAFDTDTLFVDESTDRVGIGTATPSDSLDVDGVSRLPNIRHGAAGVFTASASKTVSASVSAQDIFDIDTSGGHGSAEITIFGVDPNFPNGSFVSKLYLAWRGSGTIVVATSVAQEDKAQTVNGAVTSYGTWAASITGGSSDIIRLSWTGTAASGNISLYAHIISTDFSSISAV